MQNMTILSISFIIIWPMIQLKLEKSITIIGKLFLFNFSGRDPFPLFLKRNKLPRKFSITQPGEIGDSDYYKDSDIEVEVSS